MADIEVLVVVVLVMGLLGTAILVAVLLGNFADETTVGEAKTALLVVVLFKSRNEGH